MSLHCGVLFLKMRKIVYIFFQISDFSHFTHGPICSPEQEILCPASALTMTTIFPALYFKNFWSMTLSLQFFLLAHSLTLSLSFFHSLFPISILSRQIYAIFLSFRFLQLLCMHNSQPLVGHPPNKFKILPSL